MSEVRNVYFQIIHFHTFHMRYKIANKSKRYNHLPI